MISIFSKFKIAGGSERRCVELANGISAYLGKRVQILCREETFHPALAVDLLPNISIITDCLKKPECFYKSDVIITVNTDSRELSDRAYWERFLDVKLLRDNTLLFLYNFIVSPAKGLSEFEQDIPRVGIIVTNSKFFNELSEEEKFTDVAHLPRLVLESPIDSLKIDYSWNHNNNKFVVSCYSKAYADKWNDDIPAYVTRTLEACPNLSFKIMGVKKELRKALSDIAVETERVLLYEENEAPVPVFLRDSNALTFFPSYKREEPWARVIGEGMAAGLPILALDADGGTRSQVIQGNNGFLCKTLQDFVDKTIYLYLNRGLAQRMGKNSRIYAFHFHTTEIVRKLWAYIDGVKCQ